MIDKQIVEQARNADMTAFLERHCGFAFNTHRGAYRCKQHPSLAVKHDRRSWFWHSKGIGGYGALDYLMKIENMPFREAVETVTPYYSPAPPKRNRAEPEPPPKVLYLPEKTGFPLRLYDYLCCKRGIDSDIVNTLMQKGMIYEDRRGNVIFVGFDERGKAAFAGVRGTLENRVFRMDCSGSDKRYGFNMAFAPSARLYVFESPIDAMSHATLENAATGDRDAWKRHCRLSLAGTSDAALPFFLNRHTAARELVFCLDNDGPGREAAVSLAREYAEKGLQTRIELPEGKDWSEDLQAHRAQIQAEKRSKSSHRGVDI